jgi:hypothetical protein
MRVGLEAPGIGAAGAVIAICRLTVADQPRLRKATEPPCPTRELTEELQAR